MDRYYTESDVKQMLQDAYESGFDGPLDLMYETVATILDDYQDGVVMLKNNQRQRDYMLRTSE